MSTTGRQVAASDTKAADNNTSRKAALRAIFSEAARVRAHIEKASSKLKAMQGTRTKYQDKSTLPIL